MSFISFRKFSLALYFQTLLMPHWLSLLFLQLLLPVCKIFSVCHLSCSFLNVFSILLFFHAAFGLFSSDLSSTLIIHSSAVLNLKLKPSTDLLTWGTVVLTFRISLWYTFKSGISLVIGYGSLLKSRLGFYLLEHGK